MRSLIVAVLLALTDGAVAAPADALEPFTRELYEKGARLESEGDLRGAALWYRRVWDLEPRFEHAVVDLGRVLEAAGDADAALDAYGLLPWVYDTVEARGRLLLALDRPGEALVEFQKFRTLAPGDRAGRLLEAEAALAFDPVAAADAFEEYLEKPDGGVTEATLRLGMGVAEALRDDGHDDRARGVVRALVDQPLAPELRQMLADLEHTARVEELALQLQRTANQPLVPDAERVLDEARAALANGERGVVAERLATIEAHTPWNAEVWGVRASLHAAAGEWGEAERALAVAEALDPLSAAWPARRGRILFERYAGRYDVDALAALDRAVRRSGAPAEVWLDRARVLRALGRAAEATAAMSEFVDRAPADRRAGEARLFLADARRERLRPPAIPPAPGRPADVPSAAWEAWHLALAYRRSSDDADARADLDAALAQLAIAREHAPDWPDALNLEAGIRSAIGDRTTAAALWGRSLDADPDQVAVMEQLAALHAASGRPDEAQALLERAAARGSPASLFALAHRAYDDGDLLVARDLLDRYFSRASAGPEHAAALELRADVERWLRGAVALGASLAVVSVGLPLAVRVRSRTGSGLRELLDRSPAAFRDVARIGAAIRHEVIKHNTTVLPAVADALEERDPEPARWAAAKLYGPRGALARFRGYVGELERLGQVHGVRLNLRHRDPTLGPLMAAMDRLARLEPDLRSGQGRRLASELRELGVTLNHTGYRALGRLLRRVCLLRVDAELLRTVWNEVRSEPAFRDAPAVDLELALPEEPLVVRMFRSDLDDILVNLFRNSLEVTLAAGAERLGLRVDVEEDPVTFMERVVLRVCDDSPKRLSTAMIRGRYIGRGLGLAVDLISRGGGSVHVEPEPGWAKAVVVRLPRVEITDEDEG